MQACSAAALPFIQHHSLDKLMSLKLREAAGTGEEEKEEKKGNNKRTSARLFSCLVSMYKCVYVCLCGCV